MHKLWGNDLQRRATCRFCSAQVDRQAAETAADVQKEVNNAVNLAKWIRNAAGAMWGFVALGMFLGIASLAAIALYLSDSCIADLLANRIQSIENCKYRLRKNEARSGDCPATLVAGKCYSNPDYPCASRVLAAESNLRPR